MTNLGYLVSRHNPAESTDEELAVVHGLTTAIESELWPEDPLPPLDAAVAQHRAVPARIRRIAFRAWAPDGALVGSVGLTFDPDYDDNPEVLHCQIWVLADHRGRGIGRALLAQVVALAREEGTVTRLLGSTWSRIPAGEAFASSTGGKAVARTHTNRLLIADVDPVQLESWIDNGPRRAPDYELLGWDGPIPEEHLADFADLILVMNDAPRDDMDLNDFTVTPQELRESEGRMAAAGHELWTLVARRKSDGAFAGLHNAVWCPEFPSIVFIGSTGVRAEHRGHALGKWLKAAMTLRIMAERPQVADIRTDNADSNDAMLGINRDMGYRPMVAATTWELSVDEAARWLARQEARAPS